MKVCFIMNYWNEINPDSDSTLRIIHECSKRYQEVYITHASNVSVKDCMVKAMCHEIVESEISSCITSYYNNIIFKDKVMHFIDFDCIFIRPNPPLDIELLYFLDYIKKDVFVMNTVEGLRSAGNKLYTSSFEKNNERFTPYTYVSKDKDYIKKVIKTFPNDTMVMKPLNGYGGRGVIIIEKKASKNLNSLLDFYMSAENNYIILQEYLNGAEKGDVRILMLNGKPIGAMKRVPAGDDPRSNIHAGGREEKHQLTDKELSLCKLIGPKLVLDGLFFVGLDVINGKLLEVNVCSPGGITRINKLNGVELQAEIVDFIEENVSMMNQ